MRPRLGLNAEDGNSLPLTRKDGQSCRVRNGMSALGTKILLNQWVTLRFAAVNLRLSGYEVCVLWSGLWSLKGNRRAMRNALATAVASVFQEVAECVPRLAPWRRFGMDQPQLRRHRSGALLVA